MMKRLKLQFVPEVKENGGVLRTWKKWWSTQIAMFWCAVSALVFIWPGLVDVMPTRYWAIGGFILGFGLMMARVIKQPGSDGL